MSSAQRQEAFSGACIAAHSAPGKLSAEGHALLTFLDDAAVDVVWVHLRRGGNGVEPRLDLRAEIDQVFNRHVRRREHLHELRRGGGVVDERTKVGLAVLCDEVGECLLLAGVSGEDGEHLNEVALGAAEDCSARSGFRSGESSSSAREACGEAGQRGNGSPVEGWRFANAHCRDAQ